jgi:hypothetical protein
VNKTIIPLIVLIFPLILLLACGTANSSTYGSNTHLIENLQKQISYKIVIPTYFPKGIQPYPVAVSGPAQGAGSDGSEMIQINYQETNNVIWIIEKSTHAPHCLRNRLAYIWLKFDS